MSLSVHGSPPTSAKPGANEAGAAVPPPFSIARFWSKFGIFLILAVIFVGMSIATPSFFTATNLFNLGGQISILGLIAMGILLTVVTGNMDVPVGAVVSFVGAIIALVALGHSLSWRCLPVRPPAQRLVSSTAIFPREAETFCHRHARDDERPQGVTLLVTDGSPVYGFPDS